MDTLEESSPRGSHLSDVDVDVDSPATPSNYSSCDGSEFDRYCSANSVLGTASLCSSVGNYSDLLDSLKLSHRWNGFDGLSDGGGVETSRGDVQDAIVTEGTSTLSRIRTGSRFSTNSVEKLSAVKGKSADTVNSATGSGSVEEKSEFDGELRHSALDHPVSSLNKVNDVSLFPEEEIGFDGNLSCEESEGEDSSIGYGSGEDNMIPFLKKNSWQCSKELGGESGNPLFMSSSVAFGAGDWDEFEQESMGAAFCSMSLHEDQLHRQQTSSDPVDAPSSMVKAVDTNKPATDCKRNFDYKLYGREVPFMSSEKVSDFGAGEASSKQEVDVTELTEAHLCSSIYEQSFNALNQAFMGKEAVDEEIDGAVSLLPMVGIGRDLGLEIGAVENSDIADVLAKDEAKKPEIFDSYDEMVLEMEEILLDSVNSPGSRPTHTQQQSRHLRDGSSTASTSGTDDAYPVPQYSDKVDGVEVIGAKQKKGDVSFGERLVGVKEYTVYKLKVWSGNNQWEVERRYREFFALFSQLKLLFANHGLSLPSPWSHVEQESRKIFGNASPVVISERSILIQDCLRSILNSNYPFGTPSSLIQFLSPGQIVHSSSMLKSLVPQPLHKIVQDQQSSLLSSSTLGKTISLVVDIKPRKSMRQLLEAQHYTCDGCRRHLDAGKTLLREIVQTFGWNKPRFCEYSGQLFCAKCHANDTAILPAKVLHLWDFSLYPVSQMAKAYLESIYDQPMLCVSAVNPFLFSKVPALLQVMSIRKKIGAMFPYVRCPFRRSVQKSLGIRRYLLDSNDFFALRDLVDLSKGAFAALPIMLDALSIKILEHITEQCLVCYDSGIPCAARQDCDDPASLIFPFQEAEAEKCRSCGSIFHKPCFVKLMGCCPNGKLSKNTRRATPGPVDLDRVPDRPAVPSGSSLSSGFLSDIISKAGADKVWRPKNSSPVILMGSLPSNSL